MPGGRVLLVVITTMPIDEWEHGNGDNDNGMMENMSSGTITKMMTS